ncbi:hypothetical protein DKX38_015309 [Salix brachista]|uniref:PGG domain-containing protein n=1 Tax=Salix brachista TaxID=2182728 RepID=A0A5N5L6V4_9ROSI|nr:hypothetical protein DKX38_015309 [Salix brachista]
MPTLAVLILRALFKWRTLTYQMGSGLFWGTSRIAISPSMCTLASPSHFRFSDSPPLSARSVLATRVYSFYFLERNDQQNYRVLPCFCLMDGLSDVVKDLITCYDIIASRDYQGNTALHVAAFGGFQTPGFRRVDRQIELFTQSVSGKIVNFKDVANVKNNDGRTAFHTINQLNISDMDAMTPLELLKQQPRSTSSETPIKQLISAGGISCQFSCTLVLVKKFTTGLMHGVIQANQHLAVSVRSPSSPFSGSSLSSPISLDKEKDIDIAGTSFSNQSLKHKQASFDKKSTNQCFCFGAQGLAVKDSGTNQSYKHATPLVA